ncbi:MAG TPA: carbohydrate ABC transporter permease [Microlunatus sp.]|nr:carbohydrate ABC transporter permease [Microlunatus sp.]
MSRPVIRAHRAGPVGYAVLIVVSAILFAPFLFVCSIALSSQQTVATGRFSVIPTEFVWTNFVDVFRTEFPVGRFLLNSVVIAVLSTVGQVFSSALVGFAFARMRAPGKKIIFFVVLATMMLPAQITMIPQFILFRELGWVNTMLPLIVPNFFGGAYNIFLIRQFVSRLPTDLDDAAMVDGLGFFGIFGRIVLPLMAPVLVAISIFTITWAWGDFMGPLIYIDDESLMPLALGVQYLASTGSDLQAPPWNTVMVGSLMLVLPMIVLYYLGQRYIYEMNIIGGSAGLR